jgi:F-type H+-transporting ATPase subunit delta
MVSQAAANRYTQALFALAKEARAVDRVLAELDGLEAALARDAGSREFFESPVVEREMKLQVLDSALRSRLSELTFNFLILLVRKRRERLLPAITRQMHEFEERDANRATAHVATPAPLVGDDIAALGRRLSAIYGKSITLHPSVDPKLLGGMVVQVGDRYVDASVAGKLEEVRRHLLEGVDSSTPASPNGKPV